MRHVQIRSNKANCNLLNAGSDSIHHGFHQSTQYYMLVRSKACEKGGGVYSSYRPVQILPKLIHIFFVYKLWPCEGVLFCHTSFAMFLFSSFLVHFIYYFICIICVYNFLHYFDFWNFLVCLFVLFQNIVFQMCRTTKWITNDQFID